MIFDDILNRISNFSYDVSWKAEVSLIKVDNHDQIQKRLITLTWGLKTFKNGTGIVNGLKVKIQPTKYHIKIINDNPNTFIFEKY